MPPILMWVLVVVAAAVCGALGYYFGGENRKRTAEAKIGSAEEEAKRIVNDAIKAAEQKRKETIIEAKDEAFKLKADADKEIKDRRAEISRQERRMDQKEEALDKRTAAMERKEEDLKKRTAEADARLAEIDALRAKEMERLETLAGLSQEDAREVLLHKVDEELTHEKAVRVAAYETDLKENCDNIARNLIGQAVSRCAADHCSETTVSVVPLPSDEMKGRIIGREGRNIRALETATGVDLIIDDTPEAITLSSFDQTRREVARMTLERLIGDGRIHPARIEETVEKCRHELELQMKREGERAVMELGIHGLHPDLIKLIGRLKYRTSFGQNALTHSMEVAWVAGLLAGEMGVNVTMARRAGLLHDIGKALDHEIEGSHVQIGVDICRNIFKRYPDVHVLIFTGEILNEKLWVDVLEAGADGIILKTGELLTKTDVQAVMDGKKLVFNYPILEKIVERFKTSVRNDTKRQEAVISYDIDEYDERFLRHLALGYTKEMIANLKGMPFGVKSLEKRQNDLIGRLFGECERVGVNATRLVVRALELRILDIDNLEADEE